MSYFSNLSNKHTANRKKAEAINASKKADPKKANWGAALKSVGGTMGGYAEQIKKFVPSQALPPIAPVVMGNVFADTVKHGLDPKNSPSLNKGSGGGYAVKPGDSLSKIAARELGDANRWPEIQALNGIANPSAIQVGQKLVLPGSGGAKAETATKPKPEDSSPGISDIEVPLIGGSLPEAIPQMASAIEYLSEQGLPEDLLKPLWDANASQLDATPFTVTLSGEGVAGVGGASELVFQVSSTEVTMWQTDYVVIETAIGGKGGVKAEFKSPLKEGKTVKSNLDVGPVKIKTSVPDAENAPGCTKMTIGMGVGPVEAGVQTGVVPKSWQAGGPTLYDRDAMLELAKEMGECGELVDTKVYGKGKGEAGGKIKPPVLSVGTKVGKTKKLNSFTFGE